MTTRLGRRRRLVIPEVIQTSAMDCGVASVKALVGGFGVNVSYGRLREACQTDLDGTSINVMEKLVNALGVAASQVILPVDHVLLESGRALPAIAIIRLPNGYNHFVVGWRALGGIVQVMDPARGRRWLPAAGFLRSLYVHRARVSRSQWHAWASTPDFLDPLTMRMRQLGLRNAPELTADALADLTGGRIAHLDAAVRMATHLKRAGGLGSVRETKALIETLLLEPPHPTRDGVGSIPAQHWFAAPVSDDAMLASGAVLVRAKEGGTPASSDRTEAGPLAAAKDLLEGVENKPDNYLWGLAFAQWPLLIVPVLCMLLLVIGGIAEALLLRSLLDVQSVLSLPQERLAMFAAVPLFLLILAILDAVTMAGALHLGRVIEVQARAAFMRKIPRVANRFLRSRLMSDMAERCQAITRLRLFPATLAQAGRLVLELVATGAALAWLDPDGWPSIAILVSLALAIPFLVQGVLAERDLRVRNLNGAMIRFYLDSLRGLFAVRTHGAERALLREHEGLLVEWRTAWIALHRTNLGVEAFQAIAGFAFIYILLAGYLDRWSQQAGIVLLVYWASNIPQLAQELALMSRQYPSQRNVMLRQLEILSAPEEHRDETTASSPSQSPSGGVRIELSALCVVAGGHQLLDQVSLTIPSGSHVGIIGRSGAGKTTLLSVLLGWHKPASGSVAIDGVLLDDERQRALRRETAWVDPAIQIWNRSLIANLTFGATEPVVRMDQVVSDSELQPILASLPAGFQSSLGESGSLLSGGEGQRVRFGRAMSRASARLVILDEPFRGLMQSQRRAFLDRARRLWRSATILCVTHDVSHTTGLDYIVIVENGQVVEQGAPGGLLQVEGSRYRQLIEAEATTRETVWAGADWRQITLKDGRLVDPMTPVSTSHAD